MSVSNKELGSLIVTLLLQRMTINMRAGCLDPIRLRFTRAELREMTGAARIEDNTMSKILDTLEKSNIFVIKGVSSGNNFEVELNVVERLTKFDSVELLKDKNLSHKRLLEPRKLRPAKS